jgi:CBS domain-containing protein
MLFVIAFIVFFGAMQEQVRTETKVIAHGFRVADATIPRERLESFTHGTTVSKALSTALTSLQPLYPIVRGDELLGVIFREDILEHAATHADAYVGEIITRALPSVDENASLDDALTALEQSNVHVASVTRSGEYVGLLVYDRLADFLLLHEIRQKLPKDDDTEWSMPL